MMRQLGQLWAASVLLWLVLAIPAWLLGQEQACIDSAVAVLLCLLPMSATLWWCHRAFAGSPEAQLAAVMGGSGVRLVVVLPASIGLFFAVEALQRPAFLIWVVVYYLATLALEVVLIMRWQNAVAAAPARTEQSKS
jgi:hypothetical protein